MPDPTEHPLVLSHFSLRNASFDERVAAAAAAGFSAIGLFFRAYRQLRDEGRTPADLNAVLAHHGIELIELEALNLTTGDGEADLYEMAEVFGARHMQVIAGLEPAGPPEALVEVFAQVCDRAADVGLLVGFEYLPFSSVPDATTALRIVADAGRPNGGLCVDSWHHFRGSQAPFPASAVRSVQINDGPLVPDHPDYLTDCVSNRRPPGEGEFALREWIAMLPAGVPVSVEVISDKLDTLPPEVAARRLAAATRLVLAGSPG